jgi:hypothetical protein
MTTSSQTKSITLEHALYSIIFLVALFLRLFKLDAAPLNDGEAYWALQALELARGQLAASSAQPGYTILTGFLFFLVGDSNAFARLLPALAGSLLTWLPLVLRPALPGSPLFRRAGLLLAVALAIDPALVGLSRQAGSLMPALSFSLLALAFWLTRRSIPAGVLAGLAILSGPGLLHGLLGLSLALVIATLSAAKGKQSPGLPVTTSAAKENPSPDQPGPATLSAAKGNQSHPSTNLALLSAALTILFLGSGFGLYPRGLAGLAETLGAYLQSWVPGPGTAASLAFLPLAVLLYQPLAVIFGLVSGFRSWLSTDSEEAAVGRLLGLWVVVSFILTLLTPDRQVIDLAWTLVPLWGLASLELARYSLPVEWSNQPWIFRGAALLFGFFLLLGGYYLLYLNTMGVQPLIQAAMLAGITAMALIVAMLFAAGWHLAVTRIGLVWGCAAVLALWMLSPTWGLSQLRPNGAAEYWRSGPAAGQVNELTSTLKDLAAWDTKIASLIEIQSTVSSPSLRWALRNFGPVTFIAGLAKDQLPAAFITQESTQSPELLASYRGQDFEWEISPGWTGPLPPDLVHWLFLRKAPFASQKIILWVRADIFPGGALNP